MAASSMLDILAITGPIYCIIVLGFASTRLGLFSKADMRVLGKVVVNFALPAMLFNALAQRSVADILHPTYVVAYLVGTLGLIALGWLWCRHRGLEATHRAVVVMGMGCSNSSFVGYPILLLTLAPVAGVALALNIVVENIVVIPLVLALAEGGRHSAQGGAAVVRKTLLRLASNPMIAGLLAGLLVAGMGWHLPEPVGRTVNLFAACSGALSLLVIGGTLVGLPLHGMAQQASPVVIGKLLLHPLAVLGACLAAPWMGLTALEPSLRMAAVLLAAMPTMSIYPILAQTYGHEDLGAAALLGTTVASFFTLSALLWLGF